MWSYHSIRPKIAVVNRQIKIGEVSQILWIFVTYWRKKKLAFRLLPPLITFDQILKQRFVGKFWQNKFENETWIYHHKREIKTQSKQLTARDQLVPKKKQKLSRPQKKCWECFFFWKIHGVILIDVLCIFYGQFENRN